MDTEYFVINYCGHWEAIETLDKLLPKLKRVPPLAFIVEPINPIDRSTFVITSQQEEILRIFNLVCQK